MQGVFSSGMPAWWCWGVSSVPIPQAKLITEITLAYSDSLLFVLKWLWPLIHLSSLVFAIRMHNKYPVWSEKLHNFHVFHRDKTWVGWHARGISRDIPETSPYAGMAGTFTKASGGSLVWQSWDLSSGCGLQDMLRLSGRGSISPRFLKPIFHFLVANVRNEKHLNATCRKTPRILRYPFKFLKAKPFGSLKCSLFNKGKQLRPAPTICFLRNTYNKTTFSETIK